MLKAYKYRLYPNSDQRILVAKHFGCCRWLYNYALDKKTKAWQNDKVNLSRFEIQAELPIMKKTDKEWLKEVNSQSLQAALENLDKAYHAFFKANGGFPKFKSKASNRHSFQVPQNTKVDFYKALVFLPKFGKHGVKFKSSRSFEGNIKTSTISQTPSGKYFISILVETEDTAIEKRKVLEDSTVGVDLGIKDFAILSNGHKEANPKYLKQSLKKLNRAQKRLSHMAKGSNNRNKQRKLVSTIHEKVSNQRLDFLHKFSTQVIRENQSVALEDLNVKGMIKNHKLAQAISDVSWAKFNELLEYKAKWYGVNILRIGRFEPSSKLCTCGEKNKELKLSERKWKCKSCGAEHDRDVLAANNIKRFALKDKIGQDMPKSTPYRHELALAGAGGESPRSLD